MSHPVLPDQSLQLTAWHSAPGRGWGRVLEWLERRENAIVFGPLFSYARAHASQLIHFVLIGAGLAGLNLPFLYCLRSLLPLSDPIPVPPIYIPVALVH